MPINRKLIFSLDKFISNINCLIVYLLIDVTEAQTLYLPILIYNILFIKKILPGCSIIFFNRSFPAEDCCHIL